MVVSVCQIFSLCLLVPDGDSWVGFIDVAGFGQVSWLSGAVGRCVWVSGVVRRRFVGREAPYALGSLCGGFVWGLVGLLFLCCWELLSWLLLAVIGVVCFEEGIGWWERWCGLHYLCWPPDEVDLVLSSSSMAGSDFSSSLSDSSSRDR